ncbi:MAG TPA: EAL domain-containing protein [Candidatus Limnocylindria bacterium]|nr:EAL domain-containing protein [Candidatus Limnocylindria bacterium]
MPLRITLPRMFRKALPAGRRPGLRTVVIAPAVAVIVGMAIVVSNAVADELRRSATDAAVHGVEAIVRGYVDPNLDGTSLDLAAARDPAIDGQLERLTQSGEIRRINIWSRDGRIVYSNVPYLRGNRYSIGPLLANAFAGDGVARYADTTTGGGADAANGAGAGAPLAGGEGAGAPLAGVHAGYLELFVPIRGSVDGNPIGVYHVFQDSRLIEERIEDTRTSVFIVALIASSLLALLIWLAFGGASRVLARQNRLLEEQAATERLLVVDAQRSEERFRSLVRNASDGVLVLAEQGDIRYASPAIERILGHGAADSVDRALTDGVHPADREMVTRRVVDVSATVGGETTLELRARHADGSWRTLEAIAKNLLDDPAVNGIVVNYRDITERKALEQELSHQAFHDELTGLANRSLFHDRLVHALARGSRARSSTAVLYLDLDDFKAVNDRLGHAAGDRLLVAVGERLRASTRPEDTVARLGGDEFAVIVEADDPGEIPVAATRILVGLAAPLPLVDGEVAIRASIGIAVGTGLEDADELLRRSDIAMYAAKAGGGDCHVTYENELHDTAVARMELKQDLRGALTRGELHVVYQPIVELASGSIVGAEALIRWDHPRRGAIPPLEFISLAEDNGLILEIGRWVLDAACRQARAWQQESGRQDLAISVNLSGRQVVDPGFADDVAAALARSGLDPSALTLEITESVLVVDVETTVAAFRRLRSLGVRLAIDDFGTGYSSLSYLRQFPIDVLKIDRSFVAGLDAGGDSVGLVRSILNLCSTLRLEAVAEGIETPEQRAVLRGLGAQFGQGHLFGRAMPADRLRYALTTVVTDPSDANATAQPSPRRRADRGAAAHAAQPDTARP